MSEKEVKEYVKKRYGEIAKTEASCCPSCGPSGREVALQIGYSEDDLLNVPEAASMGLGCGNPIALASLKDGETVLDLGSGGGIDIFLAAKKVGPKGKAIGVDMTEEMVDKAAVTASKYGYENVEFRLGEIENLPIEDDSVDVVISNCVINLSPNKEKVFREAYRVLRSGGRIMISDLVTEGELPEEVRKSFDAWAGCIAGALEKDQYLDTIRQAGFQNVRIVSESTYDIDVSRELSGKITSVQVEAFKSQRWGAEQMKKGASSILDITENFFEIVEKRRAIRKYKQYDIPEEDIKKILEAARLAPSAENSQPWRFIVVKDQETKELLARPSPQAFIANANAIIVVLGDPAVSCCPRATWTTRDPMIAAEHLVLAATALGYGTCWIANYESRPSEWVNEVKRTLKIPEHIHIVVLLAIGVPNEKPSPRPRKNLQEICFREVYGNPLEFH